MSVVQWALSTSGPALILAGVALFLLFVRVGRLELSFRDRLGIIINVDSLLIQPPLFTLNIRYYSREFGHR